MPDRTDEDFPPNVVVPSTLIWKEILYIRRKVDSLEQKVLYMFGTFTAITVAIAVVELFFTKK